MASIQTSIELYDRVTGPINKMSSALYSLCGAFDSTDANLSKSFNTQAIESARAAMGSAMIDLNNIGSEIQNNQNQQENFNKSVNGGAFAMDGLLKKAMGLASAYLGMQGIRKALDLSDTMAQTTARLDMMNSEFNKINGSAKQTSELFNLIYQSAQDARGAFGDTADLVARFGNNARDAFSSQEEVVAFTNLIQKQMKIAGASAQEAANANLQLSQALGSGVLRGDELNSIFEQAPNLIQTIADYMDVPIGKIREMAGEGKITADIVKNAMFAASDDINNKFNQMPKTWGDLWTQMANTALMKFNPVLNKLNELANSNQVQAFINSFLDGITMISMLVLDLFNLIASVGSFFADNWSLIGPIIYGVAGALAFYVAVMTIANTVNAISAGIMAVKTFVMGAMATATLIATAAQSGFNAALAACPLTWIIAGILLIIILIYAVCSAIASMTGVAASGFGVIMGCIFVVMALIKNLFLLFLNVGAGIGMAAMATGQNIYIAFNNAIQGVIACFYNLLSTALSVISQIAAALSKLPFIKFDAAGLSAAAGRYASKAAAANASKMAYKDVGTAFNKGMSTFKYDNIGTAFSSGASFGDKISSKAGSMFKFGKGMEMPNMDKLLDFGKNPMGPGAGGLGSLPKSAGQTAGNTGRMADSLERTNEELKYLRDIAERDVINRFTTAEIKVDMGGVTNNLSSEMDLDGVVDYLANGVQEAMEKCAEGVHV